MASARVDGYQVHVLDYGLGPLLTEPGIQLAASQIYRLVVEKPERLSLKTLMALLDILD
jgi:hypothetical protein